MSFVNGSEIKRRRERMKLTPTQAAKAAGWKSMQQWWDIENGKRANPTIENLVRIAGVLKCKVDQLLVK